MLATKDEVKSWADEGLEGCFDYMFIVDLRGQDQPIYAMEDEHNHVKKDWEGDIKEMYCLSDIEENFDICFDLSRMFRSVKQQYFNTINWLCSLIK